MSDKYEIKLEEIKDEEIRKYILGIYDRLSRAEVNALSAKIGIDYTTTIILSVIIPAYNQKDDPNKTFIMLRNVIRNIIMKGMPKELEKVVREANQITQLITMPNDKLVN